MTSIPNDYSLPSMLPKSAKLTNKRTFETKDKSLLLEEYRCKRNAGSYSMYYYLYDTKNGQKNFLQSKQYVMAKKMRDDKDIDVISWRYPNGEIYNRLYLETPANISKYDKEGKSVKEQYRHINCDGNKTADYDLIYRNPFRLLWNWIRGKKTPNCVFFKPNGYHVDFDNEFLKGSFEVKGSISGAKILAGSVELSEDVIKKAMKEGTFPKYLEKFVKPFLKK